MTKKDIQIILVVLEYANHRRTTHKRKFLGRPDDIRRIRNNFRDYLTNWDAQEYCDETGSAKLRNGKIISEPINWGSYNKPKKIKKIKGFKHLDIIDMTSRLNKKLGEIIDKLNN